jgi:hypothetical protein
VIAQVVQLHREDKDKYECEGNTAVEHPFFEPVACADDE